MDNQVSDSPEIEVRKAESDDLNDIASAVTQERMQQVGKKTLNKLSPEAVVLLIASERDRLKDTLATTEEIEKLDQMLLTDPLTGIGNKRAFDKEFISYLKMANRHNRKGSLLAVDLDKFKVINDSLGHIPGDQVLRIAGDIFQKTLRAEDRPYRVGGEEFLVILPDTNAEQATVVAEKIRKAFEKQVKEEYLDNNPDHKSKIEKRLSTLEGADAYRNTIGTSSIGIATFNASQKLRTEEEFIEAAIAFNKAADKASYYSKNTGRNKVTHYKDVPEDEEN
jgi:diguanylate cyclase (GGDEF)-like protein